MSRRLVSRLAACVAAVAVGGAGQSLLAGESRSVADALSEEVRAVFAAHRDAVVKIQAVDRGGELSGTGFFIDPSGTVMTSYSVGGEGADLVVTSGEAKYPARRLAADCRSGIALLRIENPPKATPFLPLGKSGELAVASPVITIAYPMDMPLTPNFGMVAGFDLKYLNRYFATRHIRANVPVKRGEGGAPLLNMRGEAVGVVISGIDGGSSCFAVPIEAAEKLRRDYVRFGGLRPGWLGVRLEPQKGESGSGGSARVIDVMEHAPAKEAGVLPGDVILKIGDTPIHSAEDVIHASFFLTAGDTVPVVLRRGGQEIAMDIRAAERDKRPAAKRKDGPLGLRFGTDIILRPEH